MKKLFFIALLITVPLFSFAQNAAKNVYVDLGGSSGFISVNYDVRLSKSNKGFGVRAGAGIIFDPYNSGYTIPVGVNYLVGKRNNFLELGAGLSYFHFKETNQDSWFNFPEENFFVKSVWVGYRYQPLQKGFTFRAGLCKFFDDINIPFIKSIPSVYPVISFGYSF